MSWLLDTCTIVVYMSMFVNQEKSTCIHVDTKIIIPLKVCITNYVMYIYPSVCTRRFLNMKPRDGQAFVHGPTFTRLQ